MSYDINEVLTAPFVQSELVTLSCGQVSASVDIPEGVESFTVANPGRETAWLSLGARESKLIAVPGVGHKLMSGVRLIVQGAGGATKLAVIAEGRTEKYLVHIEFGMGGAGETRRYRGK